MKLDFKQFAESIAAVYDYQINFKETIFKVKFEDSI